jgi:CRISPR-associated endonuclease/helicase Cas3
VSARLLVTELAPWSSLVQRMGRCNRRADCHDAQVLWVDIQPKDEKDELLLPYTEDELAEARSGH